MESQIIIMLTHSDKTVGNALETFESCKDLPINFWGFKDVGLPKDKMHELVKAMKDAGKTTFLEVVSYSEDECMRGAELAVEFGFDYLMGTLFYPAVFEYLCKKEIKYLPFCGEVYGSPSVLEGTFDEIIANAQSMLDKGVFGIDLLAFRHKQGAELAEEYCRRVEKPVVIAGSISSPEKLEFVSRIKPWTFTMGTALFDAKFVPGADVRTNLEKVLEIMQSL